MDLNNLPEYHTNEREKRIAFFQGVYQLVGAIDIPDPIGEDEYVPLDEYWLQSAAAHAQLTLLDALAGILDLLNEQAETEYIETNEEEDDDDELFVYDDEA